MSLTEEEKRKVLRALREDEAFRYSVAGLIGYEEILRRFSAVDERMARLEERFADLEERQLKLEERMARLEERFADLEERQLKLEERMARLEERFADLEERQLKLEEELARGRRLMAVIAHRFGVISEASFREGLRFVLQEVFGVAEVTRLRLRDPDGLVYGHPAEVEVDALVRDGEHILIEVKSRVSRGDVAELHRIGLLYERAEGVRPRLVIVGGLIDESARESAKELGVEIRPAF